MTRKTFVQALTEWVNSDSSYLADGKPYSKGYKDGIIQAKEVVGEMLSTISIKGKDYEIDLLNELASFDSYFVDSFGLQGITKMVSNIEKDFPLLLDTYIVEPKAFKTTCEKLSEQIAACDEKQATIDELIDAMLQSAQQFSDFTLFHKVIGIKGHAYVIKRKIELDLPLVPMDREFLLNNL